jgi:GTP-binding protein
MDKISSDGVITLAIVGKPNVGKSTFFNKVLKKEISPVSDIPGTTKDLYIDILSYKNRTFKLIDSGGLKRKGKSKTDDQQYITKESLKAIYLADVVVFMIEADKEFTKTDKQICRLVLDKGKGLIFIINKIDLVDELKKIKNEYIYYIKNLFSDAQLADPFSICSLKFEFPKKLFDEVISIHARLRKNFDSKDLNKALLDIVNINKIPVYSRFRPKIKYIKQVSTRPIIFKIFGNQVNKLSLDYQKYLAKSLCKRFNIKGFKIFLRFVSSENPFKKK